MLKIIGGGALLISCILTSSYVASVEKSKIDQLEDFILLIKYIRNQIDSYSAPIEKIMRECKDILLRLDVQEEITDFSQLLLAREIKSGDNCKNILHTFADSLGKGYREQEVKLCDVTIAELDTIRKKLTEEYPNKKKTAAALCLAAGGALLIALL